MIGGAARHLGAVVGLLSLTVIVAGCTASTGSGFASPDPSAIPPQIAIEELDTAAFADVTAQLDEKAEAITTPLSTYYMSGREIMAISHANDLAMQGCMAGYGEPYPEAQLPWDLEPVAFDREYGVWSVSRAAEWGRSVPRTERDIAAEAISPAATSTPEWLQAQDSCLQATEFFDAIHTYGSTEEIMSSSMAIVYAGSQAAGIYAGRTPAYVEYGRALAKCYAEHGLTTSDETGPWGVVTPNDPEAATTVIVQDAKCHQETGAVQGMYDLRAQYEAAYIEAHESELAAAKEKKDAIVTAARDYIATHGG